MTTATRTRSLQQFVAQRRLRAFAWGSHDCCMMAADWLLEATGHDAAGLRGRYTDAAGALRLAREVFGATEAPDLFACERWPAASGLAEIAPLFAQRGDLVSVLNDRRSYDAPPAEAHVALALCLGEVAAVPGPVGLVYFSSDYWRRAWRVEQ
jgi:hypothetical protein